MTQLSDAEQSLFRHPLPLENGIYRALETRPKVPLAQTSNFWPLTARLYEPLWRRRSVELLTLGEFSVARELELMLTWTRPEAGETFLDAGCSAGLYARTLKAHEPGLNVHALDFSLSFLEEARQEAEGAGVDLTLIHADLRALPYKNESFQGVVSGGTLNELTSLPRMLAELARVLRPGGRMWQMYVTRADTGFGRLGQGPLRLSGLRFVEPESVEAQANAAGFELVRAQYRGRVALALFRKG